MVQAMAASDTPGWLQSYPDDIDWRARIEPAPLTAILDEAVARFPGRPAAWFMGRRWSYRQIGRLVDRAAAGFQALGVGKGVRVGLFLPNSPYFLVSYFAILKCGGTVVNFNPLDAARELRHKISDAGIGLMVTMDLAALYGQLQPLLGTAPLERVVVCPMAGILPFPKSLLFPFVKAKEIARTPRDARHVPWRRLIGGGPFRPVALEPEDIAVLQYTGGTTGVPKAAMLSHRALHANTLQSAMWFHRAVPGEERMLGVLPFFHVFAMTVVMNLGIRLGAEIVMLPRFELGTVMRTIATRRPTLFPAVPTIYMAVANHKERDRYDLSSIKMCISGGAPLPLDVKQSFEKATGCRLVEGYGLTEASPVVACNPLFGENRPGSIGLPLPRTEIEIVSLEDGRTTVPDGERGELCVRGPQLMTGYLNQEEETASQIRDGRLHTGDVAYRDPDGYLFIVDRIKDLIICGGFNVYPRTVEEAIYLHPKVAECVVGGVPDAYRGQTVKAWVKLCPGEELTAPALSGFLRDHLSPIEMPKQIEFRDELPKTLVGKLNRKALLEEEAAKAAAR